MSKGTKVIHVRIPPPILAEIQEIIERTADTRHKGPWTVSEFIVYSLLMELNHRERSRKWRKKKPCESK